MLDTKVVPNLIYTNLTRNMDLALLSMKKTVKVADGTMKTCLEVGKNFPATLGELKKYLLSSSPRDSFRCVDRNSRNKEAERPHRLGRSVS